ncbi:Beta-lactamase OXY-1 [Andreprevotia sp. IGB-42]|uniref:class A beta-lactamase n=1 Tax=Andreprevotia sp. IGB-42 TaxID=2497473 RepID=UPI00135C3D25|nr:class A beta-lactamase [Andreprevotia sp. IGB-42]KAF0813499.1 Beta-lactamase OXY-1 [Andreprevotia sp. IGB-42]
MTHSPSRRTLLLAAATLPLALALKNRAVAATGDPVSAGTAAGSAPALLAALEKQAGGRLGVCAIHTADGVQTGYRVDERFPFCSTFKLMLASAVLARSVHATGLLQQRIRYGKRDLVSYSPISEKHLGEGMTVAELCAATIQYSDNAAANLLIQLLGGPAAVTRFARSIGNNTFRLDRRETALNTAIPGDARDTVTPAAMARSVQALALGNALPATQREQLQAWLRGNTTGGKRILAGVPAGWAVGDKTGTGAYGTTNDIGVIWPASGAPIVLAVYYTQHGADAKPKDEVIAEATRIVVAALG